ncbi:RNA polymerase sigma factor [Ohtaekwangia koreensis]|uniref:RNA polymerase sigma-70 factor, ECF subfamily n=1 Tax=Ohtaekwangia koreensis TaxID=688867 RepID=A0A1T5J2N3_9BACT|nr:sigma-70 family RNA polymerase sigma factor [Ohtaekwangia koreensis]SKC45634.1 RNA polymerase sigma-70 factor, ECF subfamily [Ohtaekwangia koreensis]
MNYTLTSDEQLIVLMKQEEDELAFREVYRRYWREVFMVAYRKIKSREVAEELTQNLFLSLWEKRKESTILNLQPWLFGAIKYSIINYYKSQIVHEKYIKHLHVTAQASVSSTEQMTMQADLSDAIDKGVSLLPQKTQQVFKLSRFENRSVKEISRDLNISEKAVEYHITQSLKWMKVYLKDYLITMILTTQFLSL